MATTEQRVDKLETRFSTLEQQFAATMAKVDMIIGELQQQREDIRRMNEQHNADMKAAQEKHEADMKEIRSEIKGALRHIQGLTIASMVGIAAIAVGVLGFMWSSTRNTALPAPPPAQSTQIRENAGNS